MFDFLKSILPVVVSFASLAAGATSVFTGLAGAAQQRKATAAAERQYAIEAATAREAAAQEEASRRDELRRVLATQQAIRAGRGLDIGDPTGRAFALEAEEDAELDISNIRSNATRQQAALSAQAADSAARSRAAIYSGWGSATTGLLSSASALERLTR